MRTTSTRAVINLYDVTANTDGEYFTNSKQPFIDLDQLERDGYPTVKYATLEHNGFLLDGTFSIINFDTISSDDFGYWSGYLGGNNGLFTTNPKITRTFNDNHSVAGLTLAFDRHYWLPKIIRIEFRDSGGNVLNNQTFNVDSYLFFASMIVNDFKYMEIEFLEVETYTFARLNTIFYGARLEYSQNSDKNISNAKLLEELSVIGDELSINTSSLTVIDPAETFNIDNPQGYYSLLQQKQRIDIYSMLNGVEYQMAANYMKSWQTASGVVATFDCQDILGVMSGTKFKGNLYEQVPARTIIDEIMLDFGYTDYYVDDEVGNELLSGIIAPCSHKDALQLVGFAIRAVVDTSRSGTINIFSPVSSIQTQLLADRKFMNPAHTITQTDLITDVVVTAHNYMKSMELSQAYKAVVDVGVYEASFNVPYCDFMGTNCTILEYGYFYVRFEVSEESEVIIDGYKYDDFTTTFVESLKELPAGTYRNEKIANACTLISKSNAMAVARHLYRFYQFRLNHSLKFILEDEKVGNYAAVSRSNGLVPVLFNSLDIDLTGGFLATAKGIGYSLRNEDFYYTTEIYAGDIMGVM